MGEGLVDRLEQFCQGHGKSVGDQFQVDETDGFFTALDLSDIRAVKPYPVSKFCLS